MIRYGARHFSSKARRCSQLFMRHPSYHQVPPTYRAMQFKTLTSTLEANSPLHRLSTQNLALTEILEPSLCTASGTSPTLKTEDEEDVDEGNFCWQISLYKKSQLYIQ